MTNIGIGIGFCLLLLIEAVGALLHRRCLEHWTSGLCSATALNIKQAAGITVMALTIITAYTTSDASLLFSMPTGGEIWFITFAGILTLTAATGIRSARHTPVGSNFTEAISTSKPEEFYLYFILRMVFLVLYEIFFRGILLLNIIDNIGVTHAVMLNLGLYTLIHAFSPRQEILGTMPFGFVLCLLTVQLHSVWPAVLIHVTLGMSHEITLVLHLLFNVKTIEK